MAENLEQIDQCREKDRRLKVFLIAFKVCAVRTLKFKVGSIPRGAPPKGRYEVF